MTDTLNKPIHLRTGNVVTLGDPKNVDGQQVWPVNLHILTGEPLYGEEMGGENGWFVIDLETATFHKSRLTMDYNHNENEVIGYAENFKLDETGLHGEGFLVPFDEKDRASEIIHKNKAGVPYEVSPTVLPYAAEVEELPDGETEEINGREVVGPMRVYRKLPIRGLAICPYGTDRNTSATVLSEKGLTMAKATAKGKLNESDKKIDEALETPPVGDEGDGGEPAKAAHPDLEEMIEEFGEEAAYRYYRQGMTFEEAQKLEYAELKAAKMASLNEEEKPETPPVEGETTPEPAKKDDPEKTGLKAQVAKLSERINRMEKAVPRGEREPVSSGVTEKKPKPDNRPAVMKLADKYAKKS